MSDETFFPLNFIAVAKQNDDITATGLYLRWLVKPYLGLPAIYPLHYSGKFKREIANCGFRIYYNTEHDTIPTLNELQIDQIVPDNQLEYITPLATYNGWKAILKKTKEARIDINLYKKFKHNICYLRFNYSLCRRQSLRLVYKIHSASSQTDTVKEVQLHFDSLISTLKKEEYEKLTYAIHVDNDDESITEVIVRSNKPIVLGKIHFALTSELPFYIWSTSGGSGLWIEVPLNMHSIRAIDKELIQPAKYSELVDAMKGFYGEYYNVNPHQASGNQKINFIHPVPAGFQLESPIIREYLADQYRKLCDGDYNSGSGTGSKFYISPQEAAALASNDPAIAYLLGLFRVLKRSNFQRKCIFKIQGTWPEERRYCIYSDYDPSLGLIPPKMNKVSAVPSESTRVLKDYATFRNHHPINIADISWKEMKAGKSGNDVWFGPVAYLMLRTPDGRSKTTCKLPFYIPQDWELNIDTKEFHYQDWYDYYPGTDINKVLNGTYSYNVACHDIFGQLSKFQSAQTKIDPLKLEPGSIQKPEISFSKLPDPENTDILKSVDIPFELEEKESGFVLKEYNRNYLEFDYSFFWPPESSYLWNKNRATGKPSLDYFRILYLTDIPLFSNVKFTIEYNTGDGIKIELQDVIKSIGYNISANAALYSLLEKLDAVDSSGMILEQKVKAALTGGSLIFMQEWKVVNVSVNVSHSVIVLQILPASDSEREKVKEEGIYYPNRYVRITTVHHGQLYWNLSATFGGSRIGWKSLSAVDEKILPASPLKFSGKLVSEVIKPSGSPRTPSDLTNTTGIVSFKLPEQPEIPSKDYGFFIRLSESSNLAQYEKLIIIPRNWGVNQTPGEFQKSSLPADNAVDYPKSVTTLFSQDLIMSFYVTRIADDPSYPGEVIYRGDLIPFTSSDAADPGEYLLFPDSNYQEWLIVVPTVVKEMGVLLDDLIKYKSFNEDNYLTTSISLALEAVVSDQDREVKDTLQSSVATKKLSFTRFLPAPIIQLAGMPQPLFGVSANPPDYNGISLIRIKGIYGSYDLANKLSDQYQYVLYQLPSDRVLSGGMPIKYAKDTASGGMYRRNMVDLKTELSSYDANDPLNNDSLQKLFSDFAQQINKKPLSKDDFLDFAVELPGESRAVFLFAIKAYDTSAKKESEKFIALSPPTYVEDASLPAPPVIKYVDFKIKKVLPAGSATYDTFFEVSIKADRRLGDEPFFGYASESELNNFLIGADFYHIIKQYRLYFSTGKDEEIMVSPDDSDFLTISDAVMSLGDPSVFTNFNVTDFSIQFNPALLQLTITSEDLESVTITGKVKFDAAVDASDIPTRIYFCLRAENFLGHLSPLSLSPGVLREIL